MIKYNSNITYNIGGYFILCYIPMLYYMYI